jgi:class 3 adenylate cyclase
VDRTQEQRVSAAVGSHEEKPGQTYSRPTTVLFTDIVGSTRLQATLGDRKWAELLTEHLRIVRAAIDRWHGFENDTAGDGFYVTFSDPAQAIRCGLEVVDAVRPLGIEIRAGAHLGECSVVDQKCSGLTVSIGSRVAKRAGPSQLLVSQAARDHVADDDLVFTKVGRRKLKGVPGTWQLFAAQNLTLPPRTPTPPRTSRSGTAT